MKRICFCVLLAAATLAGQTSINGGRAITGSWDASGAASTKSVKTGGVAAMPAFCTTGEFYWATDGVKSRRLYSCEGTNTWVQSAYTQGPSAPAACSVGEIFFDTDAPAGANLVFCTATDTWTAMSAGGNYSAGDLLNLTASTFHVNPIDPRVVWMADEFVGTAGTTNSQSAGQLRWRQAVSGSGSSSVTAGVFANPGLITLTTGAASGNGIWLNYNGSTALLGSLVSNSDKPWEMVWVFKFPASTDYANTEMKLGIGDQQSSSFPGSHAILLRFDTVAGDSTFKFVSRVSNSETTYDSGTAPDTNFHTFRIFTDGATPNKVLFQLDGGTVRAACASGCDINAIASSASAQPFAGIYTREAAAKNLTLDYFGFKARVSTNAGRRN